MVGHFSPKSTGSAPWNLTSLPMLQVPLGLVQFLGLIGFFFNFFIILFSHWCYGKWPPGWEHKNIAILEFYPIVL